MASALRRRKKLVGPMGAGYLLIGSGNLPIYARNSFILISLDEILNLEDGERVPVSGSSKEEMKEIGCGDAVSGRISRYK